MKTSGVASSVQYAPYSMRAFETQRKLAVLSVKWNIETKQVAYPARSFTGQYFDGAFIAQSRSGFNGVFKMYARAVGRRDRSGDPSLSVTRIAFLKGGLR